MRWFTLVCCLCLFVACGAPQQVAESGDPVSDEPAGGESEAGGESATGEAEEVGGGVDTAGEAVGTPCEKELALNCPEGLIDGCVVPHPENASNKVVYWHVCIEERDAYPDDCGAGKALDCMTAGAIDACELAPPASDKHVCVLPE